MLCTFVVYYLGRERDGWSRLLHNVFEEAPHSLHKKPSGYKPLTGYKFQWDKRQYVFWQLVFMDETGVVEMIYSSLRNNFQRLTALQNESIT